MSLWLSSVTSHFHQSLIAVDAAGWAYVWSWVSERLLFAERIIDQCAPGPEM